MEHLKRIIRHEEEKKVREDIGQRPNLRQFNSNNHNYQPQINMVQPEAPPRLLIKSEV